MLLLFSLLLSTANLQARVVQTNELTIHDAPAWLLRPKVEKITDRIQTHLEWTTRRTPVYWHANESSFIKAHSLGAGPVAVTSKSTKGSVIHMSPRVSLLNYKRILGHELVHLIFYQKYRGAIPRWLEEGFANHLSRKSSVNYGWLAKQELPADVTKLGHPFKQQGVRIDVHYAVSQAVVEMLRKKCDLQNLLRLSVERKMSDYIKSYCQIPDINKAFKKWLSVKSQPVKAADRKVIKNK